MAPALMAGTNPVRSRRTVRFLRIPASLLSVLRRSHGVDYQPNMGKEIQCTEECEYGAGDTPEPADYRNVCGFARLGTGEGCGRERSEEHTSELQSRGHLVCRLLLE